MGGESAKIAAAYQPEQDCRGHLFLNDGYHTFSLEANPSNAKDLYSVALHELGHILGLCHSSNSSTVMYTEFSNNKRNLHTYDIEGIRAIYDIVKVKNEFMNKDGSYTSGGIVNVESEDYDTDGFENNEMVFVCPKSSSKTFRAKEQNVDDLYRKFNPFSDNSGGWIKYSTSYIMGTDSILRTDVSTDTYIARYRYKTTVGLNAQTEFNNNISFPSAEIYQFDQATISLPLTYQPSNSSYTYSFAGWIDGVMTNSRTVTPTQDISYTGLYKGHMLSGNTAAFSTSSQRKVVRDEDGRLNMVYESMGYVWLTTSSDNGATWSPEIKLSYNEFPSSGTASKCPSIVQADDNSGKVYVAYQFNYGDNSSGIAISAFFNGSQIWTALAEGTGISYSYDCKPVIAFHSGSISIVYRKSSLNGLYLANILLNPTTLEPQSPTISEITNTTTSSSNPSIGFGYTSQNYKFYLAYQEGSTAIKYLSFSPGTVPSTGGTNVSANGGYTYNTNPSIIQLGDGARITWTGYNSTGNAAAVFKDPDYSRYWNFDAGNGISSSSVTRTADGNYVIAWTLQNSTTNRFVINSDFNNIRTFKTSANVNLAGNLQVANGSSFADMYAMSLNTQTSPYSFQLSKKVSDIGLNKISAEETVCLGRGAVLYKDNAEVYFSLNDISADGSPVEFVEAEDTLKITETGRLNSYLETKPFSVNSNSEVLYGISYGVVDSSALASILTDNAYVNFRVELADANTNAVLSTLENIGCSKANIPSPDEKAVRLNLADIGTRQVILRVILSDNIEAGYSLVDKISSVENVSKANIQNAKYDGFTVVKEYNLEQNYPNPFNPVTTINYQLPKDGMVTLKIYDAIGTEITTLVHEYKQAGRYNVNFNASGLASGVYFYRLQVNDFTSSKKLILMK